MDSNKFIKFEIDIQLVEKGLKSVIINIRQGYYFYILKSKK